MMEISLKLHYHDSDARPWNAPHWKKIPPGTWVRDSGFWARRALDNHIYDLLVDDSGAIYFWRDGGDWYPEGTVHRNVEEAKVLAAVLHRLRSEE